jgi:hypothetical protein
MEFFKVILIMELKKAEEKYGKRMFKLMEKHLRGATLSVDPKTKELDIPQRDLDRAFDMVTKGRSDVIWD